MRLSFYSHKAPRACIADQPTGEEQNEQNEHGCEVLTNGERVRTGLNFPEIPGQDSFEWFMLIVSVSKIQIRSSKSRT